MNFVRSLCDTDTEGTGDDEEDTEVVVGADMRVVDVESVNMSCD